MTAFFTLTTAACLIGLAVYAAHVDSDARRRVDTGLLTQATQIAAGIALDDDGQILAEGGPGPGNGSLETGLQAVGSAPVALVDEHGIAYSSPGRSWLPTSRTVDRAAEAVRASRSPVYFTAPGHGGVTNRWVAVPLIDSDTSVALVGTAAVPSADHRSVVLGLTAAVVGLVLAATLAGHLLAALAMRPAVRQLEQQEQFLREASHELRTPLATVALIVESGLRDPETATTALRSVDERLSGIDFLVRSLLARARADARDTAVEQRPLRLDQLVEVTVEDLHAADRVAVDAAATVVQGNADLIGQAVRNLVENALRHAPGSTVSVTVADRCVTVSDTGPAALAGAPSAGVPSAGTPTGDASAARGQVLGTGTGLSIVTWVAEVHGAELSFDTSPRGGLEVSLRFPG
jgi:two-component system OmpR family sensor kinase